jgi:hypothetical protein
MPLQPPAAQPTPYQQLVWAQLGALCDGWWTCGVAKAAAAGPLVLWVQPPAWVLTWQPRPPRTPAGAGGSRRGPRAGPAGGGARSEQQQQQLGQRQQHRQQQAQQRSCASPKVANGGRPPACQQLHQPAAQLCLSNSNRGACALALLHVAGYLASHSIPSLPAPAAGARPAGPAPARVPGGRVPARLELSGGRWRGRQM